MVFYNNQTDLISFNETSAGDVWQACLTPNDGTRDGTETCSNNLTVLAVNDFTPDTKQVIINSSSLTNYTNESLSCYANITDADGGNVYANFTWYNNTVNYSSGQSSAFTQNTFGLVSTLGAGNTTKTENWTCSINAYDGTNYEGDWNNATLTILNSPPTQNTPILNATNNNNNTNQNLTVYDQSTADNDLDGVKNVINWNVNGTSIAVLNMPFESNTANVSNNTKDYSGYGNNGSIVDGVIWNATGGYDGKGAYQFDGVNDIITISTPSTKIAGGPFSVEAWVFAKQLPTSPGIITSMRTANGLTGDFILRSSPTGDLRFLNWRNDGEDLDGQITTVTGVIGVNRWYHIVATWNGTNNTIYVNGTSVQIISYSSAGTGWTAEGSIGRAYNAAGYFWNGTIDELRVWNRSLTPAQVLALYNNRTDLIVSQETEVGENWTACITPNDGTRDGTEACSNNLTVLSANTLPTAPVLLSPPNNSTTTNRTPSLAWNNSVDSDNDLVTYNVVIDDNSAFNNPEVNVSGISNTTSINTTYEVATELSVDTTYFWKVRGNDSVGYGEFSTTFNFTLQSYLALSLTTSTVEFGSVSPGQAVNTTTNNPFPFAAENVGNIFANVTVTGTPYFTSVSFPGSNYRFRIEENESGAFNTTISNTSWTNMNNASTSPHVLNLDWHVIKNNFLTGLSIFVPADEPSGTKSSTVTFTAES